MAPEYYEILKFYFGLHKTILKVSMAHNVMFSGCENKKNIIFFAFNYSNQNKNIPILYSQTWRVEKVFF